MKLVLVEWVDSAASSGEWEVIEAALDMRPSPCYGCGFLIAKTKEYVTIALLTGKRKNVNCVAVIPRGCIKSIKELKE